MPEITMGILDAGDYLTELAVVFETAYPNKDSTHRFYSTIYAHCSPLTLRSLYRHDEFIYSSDSDMLSHDEFDGYVVDPGTLRILFRFTNLTTIILEPYYGFDLDDSIVSEMAGAWGQVEELRLIFSYDCHRPPRRTGLTFTGIQAIVMHCSKLRTLEIFFNAKYIPSLDPARFQASLVELHVRCSPISSPMAVTAFIATLSPNLETLHSHCLADESGVNFQHWKEVTLIRSKSAIAPGDKESNDGDQTSDEGSGDQGSTDEEAYADGERSTDDDESSGDSSSGDRASRSGFSDQVGKSQMTNIPIRDNLADLQKRIQAFASDPEAIDADSKGHRVFLGFLEEACNLVRTQDTEDPHFEGDLKAVNEAINLTVELAYGPLEFDFLPSFAHSDGFPVLLGPHKDDKTFCPADTILLPKLPDPWKTTPRPHPLSSLLARFERDVVSGAAHASPLAAAIYDARCEIASDEVANPIGLTTSGTCLALSSMGRYKERTPILTYYFLDESSPSRKRLQFPLVARQAKVGLTELALASTMDEDRKLIFVADSWRIKSYAWADEQSGKVYRNALPTYTLKTDQHDGPLHVIAPGRLLRAGKGFVGVWNLDGLATHGPKGTARIGRKFSTSDTWRDDDEVIEASSGIGPTSIITLADPAVAPTRWHAHPSAPSTMLRGSDAAKTMDYSCVSVDLEHGGKTVARYLGHGGDTRAFRLVLRTPIDGHARIYDHRTALAALSLRAGLGEDDCMAAVLVHPDGAAHDQVIRLWDVRARKLMHELSTGNNAVNGMVWDAPRSALYVSTGCDYIDRNGENFDYRRAKVPKDWWRWDSRFGGGEDRLGGGVDNTAMDNGSNGESDEDEVDSDSDDEDAPNWPENAAYAENHFGRVFDAWNHRLFRYAFKDLDTGASEDLGLGAPGKGCLMDIAYSGHVTPGIALGSEQKAYKYFKLDLQFPRRFESSESLNRVLDGVTSSPLETPAQAVGGGSAVTVELQSPAVELGNKRPIYVIGGLVYLAAPICGCIASYCFKTYCMLSRLLSAALGFANDSWISISDGHPGRDPRW
ncbi:hypothetical protein FB451DRAFT_1380096 [Mycena latifolia]|nr:hypothetical protein FB451DRAFT_1380096 [Mycena latifolia]